MGNKAFDNGEEKYKERDFEGAIIEFTLALEKDPGNPDVLYQRAMSYFHLQKKILVLIDMDQAVEMQPNYAFRYSSRAFMRDSFGDVIGAISDYKLAVELDPEDAISYNNLGILEDKMGRREISQVYYNKADNMMGVKSNSKMKEMMGEGTTINYDRPNTELPKPVVEEEPKSIWEILGALFSKEGFGEFIGFVKNGFKLKE